MAWKHKQLAMQHMVKVVLLVEPGSLSEVKYYLKMTWLIHEIVRGLAVTEKSKLRADDDPSGSTRIIASYCREDQ